MDGKDLKRPFLRMLASTSEETGRFDAEISDLLLAIVKDAVSIRSLEFIFCFLELLFLRST